MKKISLLAISFMMALSAPLSAEYVTIVTGTNSSTSYPYGISRKYSTTQSIYTAAEMGGAKKIETIAYQVAWASALSTDKVEIYMGHTTKSDFYGSSDYENVSGMTLVYSGSPTLAASTGWEEFTLTTPFAYNGTSNLVVVVAKQASSYTDGKYYYISTSNTKCLYRASDDTQSYGDATSYSNFSTIKVSANVRFGTFDLTRDGIGYMLTSDTEANVVGCTATTGAVTIPATVTKDGKTYRVTSIGNSAFNGCSGLTSLSIPSSVTSIGNYAFTGCRGLTSLSIPSSVTSIGSSTFYGCSGLSSLTIPSSVTSIGNSAFYGCSGLTSISIPSSVTSIGNSAFYGCSGLTSLSIPSGVTSIGSSAFYGCSGLTSLTIPSSVTSIGGYAFTGCSGLTSLTIPSSVTRIGDDAFTGCTSVKEVKIEDGTTTLNLGYKSNSSYSSYYYGLFKDCPIERLYLGRNLSYSTRYYYSSYPGYGTPFEYQSKMKSVEIGKDVTSIEDYAFYGCSGLTSINIPSSVTSIGNDAFTGCTSVKEVKIEDGTTTLNLGYKSNSSYSSYYYGLFKDCPIEKLYLGRDLSYSTRSDNSSYPDYGAPFEYQSQMKSVEIGKNVTSIDYYAFYGCTGLTSINIPSSVTRIDYYAFYGCTGLTSLSIPSGVTSIGSSAFCGCTGLTSLSIPSGVTSIGSSAFYGCTGKLTVNCNIGSASSSNYGWFYGSNFSSVEISKDVTSIGNYAFYGNSNIQSLTIGSGVTAIGSDAFSRTSPTKVFWLTNTPPSGYSVAKGKVNYVSNNNFTSLSNTKVYAYLSSMFEDKGIKYVPVNPSERTCDAIDYAYFDVDSVLNIANTVSYRNVAMNVKEIGEYFAYNNTIVKELKIGDAIPTIRTNAFYGCSNLQEIAIPDATTSLGTYCFYGCTSLKKADIGDGVTAIPSKAFSECSALETITIGEGVKSIGTHAFSGCSSLADIAIPSNVNKIDDNAFYYCKKLADVVIADRKEALTLGYNYSSNEPLFSDCPLDSIYIGGKISYNTSSSYGYSPFYRNTSLRTVVITNEETEIYPNEFYGCTNLKNVKIGDGVKKIGDYAFSGCSSLEEFTFGTGLQSIGKEGFSDCTALKSLASKATTPPACGTQALDDVNKWDCTLYVPQANTAAYQAADQWKDFFFVSTIEGSNLEGDEEFEGVHRVIADGVMFSNTLTRDYDTITYVRNFTTHDWEAIYLPFSMSYDDWKDNYEVARINAFYQYDDDEDGKIDRSVLQAIKVKSGDTRANYPYLIRAKVPEEKSFNLYNKTVHTSKVNSTDCSTIDTKFTFVGIYSSVPGSALTNKTAYAMEEGALKKVTSAMTIPACRWYIEVEGRTAESPANAPVIRVLVSEDEESMETDLKAIEMLAEEETPTYIVDGRRATNRVPQGMYVKSGKKFIQK